VCTSRSATEFKDEAVPRVTERDRPVKDITDRLDGTAQWQLVPEAARLGQHDQRTGVYVTVDPRSSDLPRVAKRSA
jgi:hypothetical protein